LEFFIDLANSYEVDNKELQAYRTYDPKHMESTAKCLMATIFQSWHQKKLILQNGRKKRLSLLNEYSLMVLRCLKIEKQK